MHALFTGVTTAGMTLSAEGVIPLSGLFRLRIWRGCAGSGFAESLLNIRSVVHTEITALPVRVAARALWVIPP